MIFDRLADAIVGHAKLILAMWIVILVVAAPFALKAGSVMSYDTNDMADSDSESMQGFAVIGEYFPSTDADVSTVPILVMHYTDGDGLIQAEGLLDALNASVDDYKDDTGGRKLMQFLAMSPQEGEDGSGILMVGVVYNPELDVDVTNDTPLLRDFIRGVESDYTSTLSGDYGVDIYLTGNPAIMYDMSTGAAQDIARIDPFTILLILILVGLFFRSFISSATPPITIGFAFVVVMGLIFGLGQLFSIYFITEMMLLVSMMGAGCDYCIFIIARYREELRSGRSHEDALHQAVVWAGESIAVSGAAVIIGFGAMCICSFSMVSTMGICLALGILVALLAALTLIPSILALLGDRIFWPSTMRAYQEGGKATKGWFAACGRIGHRYFEASSRFSLKHAKAIVIAAVLVTVPAAYVAMTAETSYDMAGAMQTGESGDGMDLIGEYANQGLLMPDYVILDYSSDIATVAVDPASGADVLLWNDHWRNDVRPSLTSLSDSISGDDNIAYVLLPYEWDEQVADAASVVGMDDPAAMMAYIESVAPATVSQYLEVAIPMLQAKYIEALVSQGMTVEQAVPVADSMILNTGGPVIDYIVNCNGGILGGSYVQDGQAGAGGVDIIKLSVATRDSAMSPTSMDSISHVKGCVNDYITAYDGLVTEKWITGSAVVLFEVSEVISDEFNTIEVLVILLIIVLLFFVMRSYTIPFRSVLTIMMSICWTLALVHVVFGSLMDAEVMWLIPLILLVICLGLGMDYDILLTTRIRENVMAHGMDNDEAIHQAVVHTGSVITICGLIMGGAFGTLMLSSMVMMQQFGFALCFAILVDALVVRTYIVPAVMHLLGDWNWKCPGFMRSRIGRSE